MKEIFTFDSNENSFENTMEKSNEYFIKLITQHSIERPPRRFIFYHNYYFYMKLNSANG
jgi:hypothetical protein